MKPQFSAQKILFDLDGTLVDTAPDLHAATNFTLRSVGRPPVSLDHVHQMTGYGARRLIELGLEETGGTAGLDMEALHLTFLSYYRDHICDHSEIFSGGKKTLESLSAMGFQMAVCTNKPHAMAVRLLDKIGIAPFFEVVTGGDSFAYKKPDGRHLTATSSMLDCVGSTIMIGDSLPDIHAAKAANMPVIAVDFGYSDVPIESLEPDHIISCLPDLLSLVKYAHS